MGLHIDENHVSVFQTELCPLFKAHVVYLESVSVSDAFMAAVIDGSAHLCAIKAPLVLDKAQLDIALGITAMHGERGTLKSQDIFREILFRLSPSKNVCCRFSSSLIRLDWSCAQNLWVDQLV